MGLQPLYRMKVRKYNGYILVATVAGNVLVNHVMSRTSVDPHRVGRVSFEDYLRSYGLKVSN